MPKAILELPKMPESCWQCELYSTAHNCCNVCKHIGNRNGKHFECPNCGNVDHADVNAAKNIAQLGALINRPEKLCMSDSFSHTLLNTSMLAAE